MTFVQTADVVIIGGPFQFIANAREHPFLGPEEATFVRCVIDDDSAYIDHQDFCGTIALKFLFPEPTELVHIPHAETAAGGYKKRSGNYCRDDLLDTDGAFSPHDPPVMFALK